jgi:hypothetical protein
MPSYDIMGNPYVDAPGLGFAANIRGLDNLKLSKSNNWIILGNMYAELDFAKYFTFRTNFGGTLDDQYYYSYQPGFNLYAISSPNSLRRAQGFP